MTDIQKAVEEAWPKSTFAEMLPYESWERLNGETSLAYAAFCVFRDLGAERNIRKAVETAQLCSGETDNSKLEKRYRVWRNWSSQFRWLERAAGYDRNVEQMKQTELRKTIEAQGEQHRAVTGKMLEVVKKKLDLMNPEDLTQGNVTEWVQTAIKAEREAAGFVASDGKAVAKQGELNFTSDFQGL